MRMPTHAGCLGFVSHCGVLAFRCCCEFLPHLRAGIRASLFSLFLSIPVLWLEQATMARLMKIFGKLQLFRRSMAICRCSLKSNRWRRAVYVVHEASIVASIDSDESVDIFMHSLRQKHHTRYNIARRSHQEVRLDSIHGRRSSRQGFCGCGYCQCCRPSLLCGGRPR